MEQQVVVCPNCSSKNTAGQQFCGACGAKLGGGVQSGGIACPNCGSQNAAGKQFCGACGTKLPSQKQQGLGRETEPPAERGQLGVKPTWGLAWGLYWRMLLMGLLVGGIIYLIVIIVLLAFGWTFPSSLGI